MTYKEFEEGIKKLGLRCDYGCYFVSVYFLTHNSYQLAHISKEVSNIMVTTSAISQLPEKAGRRLLTLCYKLAKTPINERGKWSDL